MLTKSQPDQASPTSKRANNLLGLFWRRSGVVLGLFWGRSGFVLGLFWGWFGFVLGFLTLLARPETPSRLP